MRLFLKVYKEFLVEIDSRGNVTISIGDLFDLMELCSSGTDEDINQLKESLFNAFERNKDQTYIS